VFLPFFALEGLSFSPLFLLSPSPSFLRLRMPLWGSYPKIPPSVVFFSFFLVAFVRWTPFVLFAGHCLSDELFLPFFYSGFGSPCAPVDESPRFCTFPPLPLRSPYPGGRRKRDFTSAICPFPSFLLLAFHILFVRHNCHGSLALSEKYLTSRSKPCDTCRENWSRPGGAGEPFLSFSPPVSGSLALRLGNCYFLFSGSKKPV